MIQNLEDVSDVGDIPTLYDNWLNLTVSHLLGTAPPAAIFYQSNNVFQNIKGPYLGLSRGFGLPETPPSILHSSRVSRLTRRYVQPELWDLGIRLLKAKAHNLDVTKKTKAAGVSVMFLRDQDSTSDETPQAGGCLISVTFNRVGRTNYIHVYSRASEITKALLGDIYFLKDLMENALSEAGFTTWDPEETLIYWTTSYYTYRYVHAMLFAQWYYKSDRKLRLYLVNPDNDNQPIVNSMFRLCYKYHHGVLNWKREHKMWVKFLSRSEKDNDNWLDFLQEIQTKWPGLDAYATPKGSIVTEGDEDE